MSLLSNSYEATLRWLDGRRYAYRRMFDVRESADAHTVLADLAKFCFANDTVATTDRDQTQRLIGRREVWLRIQQHCNLDNETLWKLYGGAPLPPEN